MMRARGAQPRPMPFRLEIEDGRFARTLEVHDDLTVGTAPACGLRLESAGVGRHHARFRQFGRRVVVEDLGAKTGVHVDGRRVRRAALGVGETLRIGAANLRVVDVLPNPVGRKRRDRRSASPLRPGPVATSLVLHALVLAVLWSGVLFVGNAPVEMSHVAVGDVTPSAPLAEDAEIVPKVDPVETVVRDTREVELLPIEDELPEAPFAQDDPRFQPPAKSDPRPFEPPPEPVAQTIGVGGGLPPEVAGRSFGKGEAGGANRVAAGLVESDGGGALALRTVREKAATSNVWVIAGDYDSAEKVLHELGIAHDVLGKDALETRDIPAHVRVLVYNCTGRALSLETQRRIAAWTWAGGWVVSTDWGVERLLERGFEGTLTPLRVNERPVLTKDETVGVRPTTHKGLAAGLPPAEDHARWWLEDSSVPFTIAHGIDAEVLVRSDELERRLGNGAGAVAVTFPYGEGRVLHMLGHVYQQEGNLRGAVIVQRLVVNYLAAALRAR